jgi:predicted kinase
MDLVAHGCDSFAFEFLNRYLESTGDYAALRVFDFYAVHRALVRAKVAAIRVAQSGEATGGILERYLTVAARFAQPRTPCLLITHGLSGSGKTTLSAALVGRLPAVRIRSDVERKRLAGLSAQEGSGSALAGGLYTRDMSMQTYAHLLDGAGHALASGIDVIVDAAFLRRAQRAPFRKLAAQYGAHFVVLDCRAPETVLRARIKSRLSAGNDASEATASVLDYQLQTHEALDDAELQAIVDCSGPIDSNGVLRAIDNAVGR